MLMAMRRRMLIVVMLMEVMMIMITMANGKWYDGGDMAVMLDLLMATSNNITVQVDGWKTSGCNAPHDKCSTICNNILRLEG